MAEAEVGLRTTLKDRVQTARGLREVKGEVTGVGRSAEEAGARARIGARGFEAMRRAGHMAGRAVQAAFAGALAVGFAGYEFLKSAIEIARDSQKIQRLTTQTIKSTGHAANVTAGQVKRYSEVMSVRTGIDRESIQTGENVLLMFRNVRNELGKGNDIYKRATKAAVDLSSTPLFKGNVTTASKMLGKLLEDPVKNINALSRAGIQFSGTQLDQIKNLVAQNDLVGAQKLVLKQVNDVAGGAAAAQATWGMKAHQMWHNIEDEIGTALLPLLDRVERWFVQKGGEAIRRYAEVGVEYLVKIVDKLGDVEKKGMPLAKQVFPAVKTALGDVYDIAKKLEPVVTKTVEGFNKMPAWAKKAIVGAGAAAYVGTKTGLLGKATSLLFGHKGSGGLLSSAKPVPVFVTNEGFGGGGGGGTGSKIKGIAEKAGPGALATGIGVAGVTAIAGAAAYGTYKYFQSGLSAPSKSAMAADKAEANRRAALTSSMQSSRDFENGQLTMANSGYDFNTLLRNQKLAHKYAFDFNSELQRTHDQLDVLGNAKVAPKFTTPGLPGAQTTMDTYKATLVAAGQPVTTHIRADASQANSVLAQLQNFTFRDKYIHVHTVQGGGNSVGTDQTAHGGTPISPRSRTRQRVLPRYEGDSVTSPRIELHNHLYIDGREVTHSVKQRLKAELADR